MLGLCEETEHPGKLQNEQHLGKPNILHVDKDARGCIDAQSGKSPFHWILGLEVIFQFSIPSGTSLFPLSMQKCRERRWQVLANVGKSEGDPGTPAQCS